MCCAVVRAMSVTRNVGVFEITVCDMHFLCHQVIRMYYAEQVFV